MKKLFLVLASVLLLGGCSVDDDTSASGGGVSNGGDDMAITTYPNVVEASKTVVEGGYLVDYRVNEGRLSSIFAKIFDLLGIRINTFDFKLIAEKFLHLSFWVRSQTIDTAGTKEKYYLKSAYVKKLYASADMIGLVHSFYCDYSVDDVDKSLEFNCSNGKFFGDDVSVKGCQFTLFEPSK